MALDSSPKNPPPANGWDTDKVRHGEAGESTPPAPHRDADEDLLDAQCPAHTTERKLITRIDLHVIPFLCIMYLLAFLDRVNIANANVFGLSEELHLDGTRYNNALVVFFVPYVLLEIPSNILLKKFRPHIWLTLNMAGFGLVTLIQGFVTSYGGLVATRFFLGVFETGMFPGAFYLIGMWYRRHEAQKRYSFFFNSTTLAGAFGGLLAAAIGKMDGLRGYHGWRWIFIIEGALTIFVSIFFFFLLPDFPEESKWLTPEERAFVTARLRIDQGRSAVERSITLRDVGNVFRDYKVVLGGFMYFGLIVPAYGYAYFAPGILQTFGYDPIQTQLHSVPPWAASFGFSMLCAYLSDRTRHRFAFAVLAILICISGFAILIAVHDNTNVQYAGLFLVAMGAYTAMPIIVCWFNMNLGGHHRRAVGSAWQVGFGNIGGIIAVYAFLKRDAPFFIPGYSISISFTVLSILACVAYGVACWAANRRRDGEAAAHGSRLTEEEKTELGDMSPDYRYLL
ncbi:high-affinity nicotinic acid transporter [Gaeumannomyces tritici R3-111a-1]|uniref:High-affinity nicotinic acid transporter n=1 Tax=Gaeumannomyces tritici (strain R3-111a-1) TaxID=644352 RepID=J3NYN2_GAET3|nr:high-affinity nicotinic acid transporter [Gaeumannomyces tritici R3-111a-1]EJT76465.1 high-affinity nicotinic acid transporter [Gaeumannomyces tritici R3-111a-1]